MNRPIIGILGYAGSGKTLVAKHLVDRYGFRRTRFADPLKRMLKLGLGLSDEEVDGDLKMAPMDRFGGCTPRHMMQTLGTEWGRKRVYPDIWVDAWVNIARETEGPLVVDDVRFPNEAEVIRELGGTLWRVYRPGVGMMIHPSETAAGEIDEDALINNATTVPALLNSVDLLVKGL